MPNDPVAKVAAAIDADVSPILGKFQQIETAWKSTFGDMAATLQTGAKLGGDQFLQGANGGIQTLSQSVKNLQTQFKEGAISAQTLFDKLASLRTTYSDAFDLNTSKGFANDQTLRNAIVQAQSEIAKFEDFKMQNEIDSVAQFNSMYQKDIDNYVKSVDQKVAQVKTFKDMQLITAQEAADQLLAIYEQDAERFGADVQKKMQFEKMLSDYEKQAFSQQNSVMNDTRLTSGPKLGGSASRGFNISPIEMAKDMVVFQGLASLFTNMQEGIVGIDKSSAGLVQTLGDQVDTQQKLNDVTNQFVDIAKQYGTSATDVLDAAKLWTRQYKDVDTALTLTRNSTMLAIVDNLNVADSNKAVESSLQTLGLQINNSNDAYVQSMKLIDSWTATSHEMSVSTKDLTDGFERMAASGKQVGLSVDQMTALVAAGVRNSGRDGTVVGNMWKSVLDNIASDSPKVQKAFSALGISMTTTGANGQKELKPIWDILLELSQAAEHSTVAQTKYFSAIAGGKYQFDTLRASVTSLKTIQDAYNDSLNSTGFTQKAASAQLHTLQADLQRLSVTIQKLAHNATSGGMHDFLDGVLTGITNLIEGLQKLPAAVDWSVAGFAALLMTGKMISGMFEGLNSVFMISRAGIQFWGSAASGFVTSAATMAGATTSLTADLTAKTVVTEADTIANGEEVLSAEAATGALVTEAGAADGAAAAFGALDLASGGLTLVIGAAIAGIAALAIHLGQQSQATQQVTQDANQQKASVDQLNVSMQQSNTTTQNNVTQLEDLKQKLDDAKKAMDIAKQGSDDYKKAQNDLIGIHSQLIDLVGKEAADQIIASKDSNKAIDDEVKAMATALVDQEKIAAQRKAIEGGITDTVINNVNKRIGALDAEVAAAQNAADNLATANNISQARFGLSTPQYTAAQNRLADAGQIADMAGLRQMSILGRERQQKLQQDVANDPNVVKAEDLLKQVENGFQGGNSGGGTSGSGGGGSGGSTGGSKGSVGSGRSKSSAPKAPTIGAQLKSLFDNLQQADDNQLQVYTKRIDAASSALDDHRTALQDDESALKSNLSSTDAANVLAKEYGATTDALKTHENALAGETWEYNQLMPRVTADMKKLNDEYKAGKVTHQEYLDAMKPLQTEMDRLTKGVQDNQKALAADNREMKQNAQTMQSDIIDELKAGYQEQQQIQDEALQNQYDAQKAILEKEKQDAKDATDAQVAALTKQKDGIDAVINSLQQQWSAQDANNKLADLQNQLTNTMNDKRFEIVGTDGKLSFTYDQSKAADLQKQISDEQTTIQRDAQKQQLDDQKTALDTQIKQLQDAGTAQQTALDKQETDLTAHYNKAKSDLDAYWKYKLQQDPLQQEADRLLIKDGYKKAVIDAQAYANQMIAIYNSIHAAEVGAGSAVSSGLNAPTFNAGMIPLHFSGGGQVPFSAGVQGMDSVPALLTPGEWVVPEITFDDVMSRMSMSSSSSTTQTIHIDKLELPNVKDVPSFTEELTIFAQQGAYHTKVG